jgi:hypothetical protein
MLDLDTIRRVALALPATDEAPHHAKVAFRVKKKIFATVNIPEGRATLKFSLEDQDIFMTLTAGVVYKVPNKWGHLGWTHLDLQKANEELLQDCLHLAWCEMAPPSFRQKYPDYFSFLIREDGNDE